MDWNKADEVIKQVLENSGKYNGARCFLTAYQIAVLVDKVDGTLRDSLEIGGAGIGEHTSFAQQIARHLADISKNSDKNESTFNGRLEMQFINLKGLDVPALEGVKEFVFDKGRKPSANKFSMFRLNG